MRCDASFCPTVIIRSDLIWLSHYIAFNHICWRPHNVLLWAPSSSVYGGVFFRIALPFSTRPLPALLVEDQWSIWKDSGLVVITLSQATKLDQVGLVIRHPVNQENGGEACSGRVCLSLALADRNSDQNRHRRVSLLEQICRATDVACECCAFYFLCLLLAASVSFCQSKPITAQRFNPRRQLFTATNKLSVDMSVCWHHVDKCRDDDRMCYRK